MLDLTAPVRAFNTREAYNTTTSHQFIQPSSKPLPQVRGWAAAHKGGSTMLPISLEGLPAATQAVTQFRMRSMEATRTMLAHAVQYRTDLRYASDWKRWSMFILLWMGDDTLEDCYLSKLSDTWK